MRSHAARVLVAIASATAGLTTSPSRSAGEELGRRPPNLILVVTDDQSFDSIPHRPAVMPWLQARVQDPTNHWIRFANAFVNDPLCCPSRASILTGRYPHHTGVTDNAIEGFDESATLATWLHDGGYWTGLVGKYFTHYPGPRGDYVPPGWDRWAAGAGRAFDYYGYTLEQCPAGRASGAPSCAGGTATPVAYGAEREDYETTVLRKLAVRFLQQAPADRPFFLYFAPFAPHRPSVPASRDAGAYEDLPPTVTPGFDERDVSDKPAWVQAIPRLSAREKARYHRERRDAFETLLGVDRAVSRILETVQARGDLSNTVVVFMTDNGYSFGEHRWHGKRCPYDECVRTPFFVRYPGAAHRVERRLVSNVDVAPTLAALAGVTPTLPADGLSLVPLLEGSAPAWKRALLLELRGGARPMPQWWGVRTRRHLFVQLGTGEEELYDLSGTRGPADPYQLRNRAGEAAYADALARFRTMLAGLIAP